QSRLYCIKRYIVLTKDILVIMRKGLKRLIILFISISVSVSCLSTLALFSSVFAQDLVNDSSVLLSGDRMVPDFSAPGGYYLNDSSTAQMSDMPFDLEQVGNLLMGKAVLGTIGVSMVENVAFSGVQLINESAISVTLNHGIESSEVPPVTVIAYKISLNNSDIGSVMQSAGNNNNFMGFTPPLNSFQNDNGNGSLFDHPSSTSNKNIDNPLAIFEKIQIGSSSLTNSNWVSPHTLTMGMVKNLNYQSDFDFILVLAIPYTGLPNTNE
ncbi:MAG: hypothetical protein M3530_03665, partial [Thermoproteota archaeon]|nr:hypothetical protein [Thermoproteota archaeon]